MFKSLVSSTAKTMAVTIIFCALLAAFASILAIGAGYTEFLHVFEISAALVLMIWFVLFVSAEPKHEDVEEELKKETSLWEQNVH